MPKLEFQGDAVDLTTTSQIMAEEEITKRAATLQTPGSMEVIYNVKHPSGGLPGDRGETLVSGESRRCVI